VRASGTRTRDGREKGKESQTVNGGRDESTYKVMLSFIHKRCQESLLRFHRQKGRGNDCWTKQKKMKRSGWLT
jgi:hypothetical protein